MINEDNMHFVKDIDILDARPRMEDEPGDHTYSMVVYPPEGAPSGAKLVTVFWYEDGRIEIQDADGIRFRCEAFERDEDGQEVYTFIREYE